MVLPVVHATTSATYELLPLAYRDADRKLDYPLLRWLSLLADQLGAVTDVLDRIDVDDQDPTSTSALTDPDTADAAWLPWLAQFVGIRGGQDAPDLRGYGHGLYGSGYYGGAGNPSGVLDLRTAIKNRRYDRGTKASIIRTAQRFLTPDAPVTVTERVGDRWHYTVHVYSTDVLDDSALAGALEEENPAGMVLTLAISEGSYADLAASAADYAALAAEFSDYAEMSTYVP